MKAWILDESPGDYRWGEIEGAEPHDDEVRIRVVASALNHMDLWLRRGQPRPKLPHIPGCDAAGVVDALGRTVTHVSVGDEVVINPAVSPVDEVVALGNDSPLGRGFGILGEQRWGAHAEHLVVPGRNVVPKPPKLTWEASAAFGLCYLTAWRMLRRARLQAGETLLVVGVGGGVASAAVALGVHLGAEVYATSGDASKLRRAQELGAAGGFASDDDWSVRADVVVESVGPATWDRSLRALKSGGRLVVCGGTSGPEVTLSLPRLFFKQYEIIGSTMGSYQEFANVVRLVEHGVPVIVDETFSLDRYPDALDRLERGEQFGKIVLTHSPS